MTQAYEVIPLSRRQLAWFAGMLAAGALGFVALRAGVAIALLIPWAIAGGLAILRRPWLSLALFVASVPVQQIGAAGPLTLTRASIPVVLLALVVGATVQRRTWRSSALLIPLSALTAWIFATAAFARDPSASLTEGTRWVIALLTIVATLQLAGESPFVLRVVVCAMAFAGAVEAGVGAALGVLGIGPESFAVAGSFSRAYGTFGRPNTFAGYLEITLFITGWLAVEETRRAVPLARAYRAARRLGYHASAAERWALLRALALAGFLAGSTLVMLGGVLVSYSRGAWLGVAAGATVTLVLATRRWWLVGLACMPIVALLVVLAAGQLAPAALTERLDSIVDQFRPIDAASVTITDDNFAVAERVAHWQAGWHMFEDHPLTGVGAGNFNVRYPDYFVREEFRFSQGHAHNYYIHLLAETGIVGLFLYLVLIASVILLAARVALAAPAGVSRAIALGVLGTMVAATVHNGFENLHVLNLGVQLAAGWGLLLVVHRWWRRDQPDASVEYSRE